MSEFNRAPASVIVRARVTQERITIVDSDDYTEVLADFEGYRAREEAAEWLEQDRQAYSKTYKYIV